MRRGFTLIEMLIALAVFGVIIAIVRPILTGVRDRSAETVVLSQASSLQAALGQWVGDQPSLVGAYQKWESYFGSGSGLGMRGFIEELRPYIAEKSIDEFLASPNTGGNRIGSAAFDETGTVVRVVWNREDMFTQPPRVVVAE